MAERGLVIGTNRFNCADSLCGKSHRLARFSTVADIAEMAVTCYL
jgi:hypothetical protein